MRDDCIDLALRGETAEASEAQARLRLVRKTRRELTRAGLLVLQRRGAGEGRAGEVRALVGHRRGEDPVRGEALPGRGMRRERTWWAAFWFLGCKSSLLQPNAYTTFADVFYVRLFASRKAAYMR